MKIINPSTFYVELGDSLSYNNKALRYLKTFLSAKELNQKEPTVIKIAHRRDFFTKDKKIELWVKNKEGYTGLSGIVRGKDTDIWFLEKNGTTSFCPFPIFKRISKK